MSITEIARPTDRADWLKLRHVHANASDAGVYMNCHPFKSLADLVVEKLAAEPEDITSRAMERGNRLEAAVADWWAADHGLEVYEPEVMYCSGRLLATLDRRIVGADRDAVEVKTTAKRVGGVEEHWFWQGQAQMLCADLDRVHFAVLDGSMDLVSYTIERDDEAIERLVAAVESVWTWLDLGMTPEGCDLAAEHLAKLYPSPAPGSVVEAEGDGIAIVQAWLRAKDELSEAEKAEKTCRDKLCALLGDAEAVAVNGKPFVTWKAQTRTSFDSKALLADQPELGAKYERTSAFRVLRAVKK